MNKLYRPHELVQYYLYYFLEQAKQAGKEGEIGKWGKKKNELAKRFWSRLEQMEDQTITPVDTYQSINDISLEDLTRKYLTPGIPVIIKGAAKEWGAIKKWNLDFFANNYGDTMLPFLESKGEGDNRYVEKRVDEICREIGNGSRKYVKFSNVILKNKELRDDFDIKQIERINSVKKHVPASIQLFMGGPGTKTTIHTALSNVTFVQVYGTKRWLTLPKEWTPIMNPLVDREPQFMADDYICDVESPKIKHLTRKMPFKEVFLEAGDVYFNPAFLWHHVANDSTSIGVAFRWVSYRAVMRAPILTSLVMMSQLPTIMKLLDHTKGKYFPTKYP